MTNGINGREENTLTKQIQKYKREKDDLFMTTVTTNTKELAKDLQVLLEEKLDVKTNNPTAKEIVESLINSIFERVAKGETVKLGSYANLVPKVQAARTARNPQTGEPIEVPEKNAVGFKAQKKLKDLLNA